GSAPHVLPEPRTATAARGSCERPRNLQRLPGRDHLAEPPLVRTVAAVLVGMIAAHEVGVALTERMPVRVLIQAEHGERAPLGLAESRWLAVPVAREARRNRVQRVGEIAPSRRRVGAVGGELAA